MSSNKKIVGGQAAPSPIPWQASIRSWQFGGHYCGGTILDAKTILTAAHCQVTTNNYIMVGEINVNEGQGIAIADVINNINYNDNDYSMDNDIAIIKLATPLTLGGDVQALCLPSTNFNPNVGANCFVSGWGSLASEGSYPTRLQYVGVPVSSQSYCNTIYGTITDNMICAGFEEGGKDSCQGDSGGPFVCMEGQTPVITGVVSFGWYCALPGIPGVYARVTPYLDWIKQHMEDPGSPPTSTAAPPSTGCENNDYVGDNYCDDGNNNAGCNFDGGDCCGDNVNNDYCNVCECLEGSTAVPTTAAPTTAAPTTAAPTTSEGPGTGGCELPNYVGDKYCDDENNNAGCDYDGGDCCGDEINTSYCFVCECFEGSTAAPTTSTPTTEVCSYSL